MVKKEVKNAAIAGAVIAVAIAVLATYFNSLDRTESSGNGMQSITANVTMAEEGKYPLAPKLVGITGYLNTTPEELKDETKNKVVLYDFWTYSCINCLRTLPFLEQWNAKYADKGLVIVGIHSPEFDFEKDISNVRMAVQKYNITYPVVLDSNHATWDAFGNRYWPAEYMTDYLGHIRYVHFGEGEYNRTEQAIQVLLNQRSQALGLGINATIPLVDIQPHTFSNRQTSELYFGYNFAAGRNFLGNREGFQPDQTVNYTLPENLEKDHFYLEGSWQNLPDRMSLSSDNGEIVLPYYAKDVNIVASGPGVDVKVLLDGSPVSPSYAGTDLQNGIVHVFENRLYNVISSQQAGPHTLTLLPKSGFQIYTFTFG